MPIGHDIHSAGAGVDSSNLSLVYHSWQCPPSSEKSDVRLSWLKQSMTNGLNMLKAETAYSSIETGIEAISAKVIRDFKIGGDKNNDEETVVFINRIKRQIREIVSTLSNLNPRWRYTSSNIKDKDVVSLLNKRYEHWWGSSFADRQIKKALQWAAISVGYLAPRWKINPYTQQPDCYLDVLGPLDVLIDQLGSDQDIQRAYAVHLRYTEPYSNVLKEWWMQRDRIKPDRMGAPLPSSGDGASRRWFGRSLIYRLFGGGDLNTNAEHAGVTTSPEVDIFHTYILDPQLNETGEELHTDEFTKTDGEHSTSGTTWEYRVPSLGAPIPTGRMIPQTQTSFTVDEFNREIPVQNIQMVPETRPATRADASLYPQRRLIIWCNSGVLYDGPSYYLHGQVPVVPFKLDEWPWEYLGYSLVSEVSTLNDAMNSLISSAVQTQKLRLDPPVSYSEKEYQRETMKRFRLRKPGTKLARSGLIKDSLAPTLPYQHYEMPIQLVPFLQMLVEMSDHQQGVNDLTALAKLGQMPSADAMEKMLEAVGPLVNDQARTMERSLTLLGYQVMWCFFQFDNTARRIQMFGTDGVTEHDFDYDPGMFVPSNVPGVPITESFARKAKVWGQAFSFSITPNSSFNITDIQTKLLHLQLWRDPKNFPIDPWTLAEVVGLSNFGKPPADTIMERWKVWMDFIQKYQLQKQIEAQTEMGMAQIQLQQYAAMQQLMADPRMGAMMQLLGVDGAGGANGQPPQNGMAPAQSGPGQDGSSPRAPGRPPEAQKAPSLEAKSDLGGRGPRSTIAES